MHEAVEQHITQVLSQGANDRFKQEIGKTFSYQLLDSNFSTVLKSGKCVILNRQYAPHIDCDVITIRDIDTNQVSTANQFRLKLKEI